MEVAPNGRVIVPFGQLYLTSFQGLRLVADIPGRADGFIAAPSLDVACERAIGAENKDRTMNLVSLRMCARTGTYAAPTISSALLVVPVWRAASLRRVLIPNPNHGVRFSVVTSSTF